MAPCLDVYVWTSPEHRRFALERFIERYVNTEEPGDPRFEAFERAHVHENATDADREALADLRRDDSAGDAYSLYLHRRHSRGRSGPKTQEPWCDLNQPIPFDLDGVDPR